MNNRYLKYVVLVEISVISIILFRTLIPHVVPPQGRPSHLRCATFPQGKAYYGYLTKTRKLLGKPLLPIIRFSSHFLSLSGPIFLCFPVSDARRCHVGEASRNLQV